MYNFYIIATPIGNIDEISQRAINTLKIVDYIFCENQKITLKLLSLLKIDFKNKKLFTFNIVNENDCFAKINYYLQQGNCALISDAGYPCISDPGYLLIKFLHALNINPIVINGPCSIIHALILSGYETNNFYFHGFLNKKQTKRKAELWYLKTTIYSTIIIFESVHRLKYTLNDIYEVFGDIEIAVVKELTKLHETVYKNKVSVLIDQINYQGEFIIVLKNIKQKANFNMQVIAEVEALLKQNMQLKLACKLVGYKYNLKTSEIYNNFLKK